MEPVYEMKLQLFSNQYYEFVDKFVKTDFEDNKVLGKFYTNFELAETMIADLLQNYSMAWGLAKIRVIDPFCGDGRLIRILLLQMACDERFSGAEIEAVLWDVDKDAVKNAKESIEEMSKEISLSVNVITSCADTFVMYAEEEKSFDICVTNPPWGLLKPQKLFNSRCTAEEIEEYKKSIAIYDDYMRSEFPLSQPTKKFGRWGTNLGRVGTEVALRLIKRDGICGIVSPASLFNDQVSIPLREWIFESRKILSISYYPAELKLYGSADVSSIAAIFGCGKTTADFVTKLHGVDGKVERKKLSNESFEYIKRNMYAIPLESGFDTIDILLRLEAMPSVLQYCDEHGLKFIRELDETRISEKLASSGDIVFAKGYMVDRYTFSQDGLYLNESVVEAPETTKQWKLVWRDVSRNTQKRRMKATLLPPGCIAGNSLGVIYAEEEQYLDNLKVLLALLNSMVFEFQARSLLVSNHVSAGIIKQIRVPFGAADERIVNIVDGQLEGAENETILEALVAKMYGISFEQFNSIVDGFELDKEEKKLVLSEAARILKEE